MRYHLAQINIGRMKGEIDSPVMASFVARLAEVNALADTYPGFVWRLKTEDGDATAIQPYEDDRIIVNMSVWQGLAELREYVYRSFHGEVMRQRREWFERLQESYYAMWWVPAGHIPSVAEAKERLEHLRTHGESAFAFTFAQPHPAPHMPDQSVQAYYDGCPTA